MERIKLNLDRASGAYSDALKKMKDGKGNIIRTAERIRELGGFDDQKSLPTDFQNF
jgi:DNA recombination protein RmuC